MVHDGKRAEEEGENVGLDFGGLYLKLTAFFCF